MPGRQVTSTAEAASEFEAVSPGLLASECSTPIFVYSRSILRQRLECFTEALKASFPRSRAFYSMKANPNPWILWECVSAGWGVDVCSIGDVKIAARAGVRGEAMSFTGVGPKREDFLAAAGSVSWLNLCNPGQVADAFSIEEPPTIGLRVRPASVQSGVSYESDKFGMTPHEAADAVARLRAAGLIVEGLHCHVGSAITDEVKHARAISAAYAECIAALDSDARARIRYLNTGGGMGIRYDRNQGGIDPARLFRELRTQMEKVFDLLGHSDVEVHAEPGEWVVGPSGALLCRVVHAFDRAERRIVLVDGSMNQYMGTSFYEPNNQISLLVADERPARDHIIYGATNSPSDIFAVDVRLPEVHSGDLIAVHCTGAYGYSRGAVFNEHPQAGEVLVDGERYAVIREAERVEDLDRTVPDCLEWIDGRRNQRS